MTNNYMNPNANAMTPNAMNPTMPADPSAQQFILPEMVDDSFSTEDIGEDFDGIRLSFRRVKIPSGGTIQFEVPGDDPENPDYVKNIEGVILYNHAACAYWAAGSEYDENTPPLCSSMDGKQGIGTPGGTCAICPFNEYGTATDAKGNPARGKACKNMRQLYILRSGEYMPLQLSLPPTSLSNFNEFMNNVFVNRRRPTWASVVQIGLKKVDNGANSYSVATFRKLHDFTGEEIPPMKAYATNFREQLKQSLEQRPAFAENVVEGDVLYEGTPAPAYQTVEQGTGMPFGAPYGVIDGDRDTLPN